MSRLDYFLLPMHLVNLVQEVEIVSQPFSDHSIVEMNLDLSENIRGRGYWKLNNLHLEQKDYIDKINEILDYAEICYDDINPSLKLEMIKKDVTEFSMYYSHKVASERKIKLQSLNKQLNSCEKKLACINLNSDKAVRLIEKVNTRIDTIKEELRKINEINIKGTMLRSKSRYYEMGESNTKYFLGLEKANAKSKVMTQVITEKQEIITSPKKVLQEQRRFYEVLYTSNPKINFEMKTPPPVTLFDTDKKGLDSTLTLEELGIALVQTKHNKSPGPDGIGADFYKVFFGRMKHILLKAFIHCFDVKRMHTSAREGIISLIPKKNTDSRFLKNWRPIILLCSDYKLLAKTISNRIRSHLDILINKAQSSFIPGRNIADNIRLVSDTIQYAAKKKINGLILTLDFQKAFDRVEIPSLIKALQYFNFGDRLIAWIKILFTDFKLYVCNNGYASDPLTPTRGLFQGNPVSPAGFILIIELLAIMIRANNRIKGIKVKDTEILLSMFVDDVNLLISDTAVTCQAVIKTIEEFEQLSGLLINYDKSHVYWIGSLKNARAKDYALRKLQWSTGAVNVLGIFISEKDQEMIEENILPLLDKAKNILDLWKMRGLSILGSVLIFNSLIASLFVYRLTILGKLNKTLINKYDMLARNFIWTGKPLLPLKLIQGNKADGGLGLVNLHNKDRALKIQWVFRIQQNPMIKALAYELMDNPIGDLIWEATLDKADIKYFCTKENFWTDVLEVWGELNCYMPKNAQQVKNQMIWMNSNIRINDKPVVYGKWINSGIIKIKDILTESNSFLSIK